MTEVALRMHAVTALVAEAQHFPGEHVREPWSLVKLTALDDKGTELSLSLFLDQRGALGRQAADILTAAINEAAVAIAALTAVPVETVVEAA